jgi:hypothetical protein
MYSSTIKVIADKCGIMQTTESTISGFFYGGVQQVA